MADGSGSILAAADEWSRYKPEDYVAIVGFAGAGGVDQAIEKALNREPDAGINHWPLACSVREANYPRSETHCADMHETDPMAVCPGRPVGLFWISPDCTHFSPAKGGTPVSDDIRGLAWCLIPWLKKRRPRVFILENVPAFLTWGPLVERVNPKTGKTEMYPDKDREGETFEEWRATAEAEDYVLEIRKASMAAKYGDPTIRTRLIIIGRCDGEPIVWPEPTHGHRFDPVVLAGGLKPFESAASCIDFTRECPSIFMTKEEAKGRRPRLKRPLETATFDRIWKGIWRHTLNTRDPFLVKITQRRFDADRAHSLRDPMKTLTGAKGGEFALVTPVLTGCGGRMAQSEPLHVADPYNTLTAKNDSCLAVAHLEQMNTRSAGRSMADPLATGRARPHDALIACHMEQANTGMIGHDLRDGLSTIVSRGTTQRLIAAELSQLRGSNVGKGDLTDPVPSLMAGGQHQALLAASLNSYYSSGTGNVSGLDDPAATLTGKDRICLVEAHLARCGSPRPAALAAFLAHYAGALTEEDIADPLRSAESRARWGIVLVPVLTGEGQVHHEPFQIVDIGMRMLDPVTEMARAMGWRRNYKLDRDALGRPISKTAITKMIGNGVCLEWACAHIEPNCGFMKLARAA